MKKLLLLFVLLFFAANYSEAQDKPQADDDIIGVWLSAGDNISPLLQTIFSNNIDSIYASFLPGQVYSVLQVNKDGTFLYYSGVYSIQASGVGDIYTISIQQSLPVVAEVSGIYEVDMSQNPDFLTYEVVQTSGTQNVPPTPQAGFGSTNGGVFGMLNVQKYIRLAGGMHSEADIWGRWLSTGANIAPLLQTIFSNNIDSIYASFSPDGTYLVNQLNVDGTFLNYGGTYSVQASSVDYIYTIVITQTTPAVATVEGMFEVDLSENPNFLTYEVVQTSGTQNVPPTPAAGFGSTNGGAFGTLNVQKYIRVDYITSVKPVEGAPEGFSLEQNYPNPFNPSTTISFSVLNSGNVKLSVYNILGQEVRTLVNEEMPAGIYNVKFDGSDLTSGIYLYKIETADFVQVRKMMLVK